MKFESRASKGKIMRQKNKTWTFSPVLWYNQDAWCEKYQSHGSGYQTAGGRKMCQLSHYYNTWKSSFSGETFSISFLFLPISRNICTNEAFLTGTSNQRTFCWTRTTFLSCQTSAWPRSSAIRDKNECWRGNAELCLISPQRSLWGLNTPPNPPISGQPASSFSPC